MKILSVVCARSGSKGLKNKCIAKIKNKMVVEYSILYSLSLGKNVKTVVSTDIAAVIAYCQRNNIEYIKRNPVLCTDGARIDDTLADAIERKGEGCDYCSLVYGNIPTRYPKIFNEGLSYLKKNKDYDAVISMHTVGKYHPEWTFNYSDSVLPKVKEKHYRRQTLSPKMVHDGHTFIFKIRDFCKKFKGMISYDRGHKYSIFGNKIKPLITDEIVIDIDTGKDLILANALIGIQRRKHSKIENF